MTIQQFIEKAIEGGWKPWAHMFSDPEEPNRVPPPVLSVRVGVEEEYECDHANIFEVQFDDSWEELSRIAFSIDQAWLDIDAWKAVGKTEGWIHETSRGRRTSSHKNCHPYCEWLKYFAEMPLALASGKTIEEYLSTL